MRAIFIGQVAPEMVPKNSPRQKKETAPRKDTNIAQHAHYLEAALFLFLFKMAFGPIFIGESIPKRHKHCPNTHYLEAVLFYISFYCFYISQNVYQTKVNLECS